MLAKNLENLDFGKIFKSVSSLSDDFVDIFIETRVSTLLSNEGKRLEKAVNGITQGAGLRLISGNKTYYAFTNNITEANLLSIAGSLKKAAYAGKNADNGNFVLNLNERKSAIDFNIIKDVTDVSIDDKLSKVKPAVDFAWGYDKRIAQVNVTYSDYRQDVLIVNSKGDFVKDFRENIAFISHVVVVSGDKIEAGYEVAGGFSGFEFFEVNDPESIVSRAVERALKQLDAPFAPQGTMPTVLSSEAGGTMIHEAIGHGLEADIAGNGLSVYSDKIGEPVASKHITVIDDSSLAGKRGFYRFDDEGTPSARNVLVENGVLKKYMSDRLSNIKFGYELTGNGRRQSYEHIPVVRMSNTMIAPGEIEPEDIIKSVDKGLFVKKMGGGQVNTVTGDFVFDVMEGYVIENGKVGNPVRGATLIGNGPKVLKDIDMVGSDLGFGIGTCGKDGQGAPVSDAQPTLRIPSIVVGGKNNNA